MGPYQVVKSRRITEKSKLLESLHEKESNPSLRKCKHPKYVFVVDKNANKYQIKEAIEFIYKEKDIKVLSVNTILNKPKKKKARPRKGARPRVGKTASFKKAIVTFALGDFLDE